MAAKVRADDVVGGESGEGPGVAGHARSTPDLEAPRPPLARDLIPFEEIPWGPEGDASVVDETVGGSGEGGSAAVRVMRASLAAISSIWGRQMLAPSPAAPKAESPVAEEEVDCPICFESVPLSRSWRPASCTDAEHIICFACASEFVGHQLKNGKKTDQLGCPGGEDCGGNVVEADVAALAKYGGSVFALYQRFALKETGKYCDCPSCKELVIIPLMGGYTECEKCHTAFCSSHGRAHGPEESCTAYTRRLARSESASYSVIRSDSVACPGCMTRTYKESGCNHMTCTLCGMEFCWLCGCATPLMWADIHFASMNCFGCPGEQFSAGRCHSRSHVWWMHTLLYPLNLTIFFTLVALIPFLALLGTLISTIAVPVYAYRSGRRRDLLLWIVPVYAVVAPLAVMSLHLFPLVVGLTYRLYSCLPRSLRIL